MNNIGTRLREIRISKGLTQDQLAEKLQCSNKAISCYENNKNLDKVYDFQKICEFLDEDINYLITGNRYSNCNEITLQEQQILSAYRNLIDSDKRVIDFILGIGKDNIGIESKKIQSSKIYRIPIYPQRAAAGVGQLGQDSDYHMENINIDNIPDNAIFGMYIKGDSMSDQIKDGVTVLIDPKIEKHYLDDKIVVANFKGEIICKRYLVKSDCILFKSDNRACKNEDKISYSNSDYEIIGQVLGVIEDDKFVEVR